VQIHHEINRRAAGRRHDQVPGRSLVQRAHRIPHPGTRARPRRRATVRGRNRRQAKGAAAMVTDQARTGVSVRRGTVGCASPAAPVLAARRARDPLAAADRARRRSGVRAGGPGAGVGRRSWPIPCRAPAPPGPRTQPGAGTAGKLTRPGGRGPGPLDARQASVPVIEPARKGSSRRERLRLGSTAGPAGRLKIGCVSNHLPRSRIARREQSHAHSHTGGGHGPGAGRCCGRRTRGRRRTIRDSLTLIREAGDAEGW